MADAPPAPPDAPPPPPDAPPPPPDAPPPPPDSPPADAPPAAPPAPPVTAGTHYMPIVIMTGVFGALFIILPLLIRKGPNRGLIRCCIMMSLFCLWIFWVTIYISQMNPIMGPRIRNTSLAWLAYKIGNPIKHSAPSGEDEQPE